MARKTKKERQADRVAEIDASLPPLDIGQFNEIEPPRNTHYTVVQVLNAGETIIRGATLRDAEFLHGFTRGALRAWQRDARRAERGQQAPLGRWAQACADTVERALAIRRLRWQALAEEGGGGSHAALWMLERRGGKEFHAPAQRHEVTRESREVVAHVSLDSALDATSRELGIPLEDLRAQGDYWARAMTAQQRGEALPPPVIIDHEDKHNGS